MMDFRQRKQFKVVFQVFFLCTLSSYEIRLPQENYGSATPCSLVLVHRYRRFVDEYLYGRFLRNFGNRLPGYTL
jgi:hypothetical protein